MIVVTNKLFIIFLYNAWKTNETCLQMCFSKDYFHFCLDPTIPNDSKHLYLTNQSFPTDLKVKENLEMSGNLTMENV